MYIIKRKEDLQDLLTINSKSIGFVPTMGALHSGHISLINKSKAENKITVCSIFVNPTQFNDKKDFKKYPITIEADIELLIQADADILFLPSVEEMYPDGLLNINKYNIGYLDTILDGEYRPGHFNGVCVVVHKLLELVKPQKIYLGEKDFQQVMVISQLLRTENISCEVVSCPTLREIDGLAMSSRNMRLSEDARMKASLIFQCLNQIKSEFQMKNFIHLKNECLQKLLTAGFENEYLILANADTLNIISDFDNTQKMVILIASKLDNVRLIDNMRIN